MGKKKIAIVTGATKGIGRAIVDTLYIHNYFIIAIARTQSDLDQLSRDYEDCICYQVDLSIKHEITELCNSLLSQELIPDVIVNNAGVFIPGTISEEEDGSLEKMIETNLYSAYYLTRGLLPAMKSRRKGYIFNICSVASLKAYPNGGSYAISKFALLGFSKNLRYELKDYDIKVSSIMPGATMSASWEGVDVDPDRLMEPEDIAKVIGLAINMSEKAVLEDIIIRPQLGDL